MTNVAIRLEDGPFAGHTNIYALAWPPPDHIVAFTVRNQVAVADAQHETDACEIADDVARYMKVRQSSLCDEQANASSRVVRGATYVEAATA